MLSLLACYLEAAGLMHRRVQACICYQGLSGWEAIRIFHQCKESGYQVGAQTRDLGHNLPCLGVAQAGLGLQGMGDFMVLFFEALPQGKQVLKVQTGHLVIQSQGGSGKVLKFGC